MGPTPSDPDGTDHRPAVHAAIHAAITPGPPGRRAHLRAIRVSMQIAGWGLIAISVMLAIAASPWFIFLAVLMGLPIVLSARDATLDQFADGQQAAWMMLAAASFLIALAIVYLLIYLTI